MSNRAPSSHGAPATTGVRTTAHRGAPITLAGESFLALASRTLWWEATRTLILADTHLGKAETFAAHGVPLPVGMAERQLACLTDAIVRARASRVLVLGDLLHASAGLTEDMVRAVAAWRLALDRALGGRVEVALVPGNHDRAVARVAERWGLTLLEPTHEERGVLFTHEPREERGRAVIAGHVHPVVTLRTSVDSMKLACFVLDQRTERDGAVTSVLTLPACCEFSSGAGMARRPGRTMLAIAPTGEVLRLGS